MSNIVGIKFAVKSTTDGKIIFNGNGTGWKEFAAARGTARQLNLQAMLSPQHSKTPRYVVVVLTEVAGDEIAV